MVSKKKRSHGNDAIEPEKENDEVRVADYELSREQRIKENLERMQKLGIFELSRNLKPPPKPKTLRPQKPLPPSPTSLRRSSRIQTLPTVDYSAKHVQVIKDVKIEIKTCHQCRKKTAGDRAQCCKCKIVHGQFCGHCLLTRYGENVLKAKANPEWLCPVCRDICNCFRCHRVKGWEPTGNIYNKVLHLGFKSVAHYLIHTRGPKGYKSDGLNADDTDEDSSSGEEDYI